MIKCVCLHCCLPLALPLQLMFNLNSSTLSIICTCLKSYKGAAGWSAHTTTVQPAWLKTCLYLWVPFCVCACVFVCVSILDSHLLMTLSKGEGGACVYMRGARKAFYSNTIYCEESENLTQRVKLGGADRGMHRHENKLVETTERFGDEKGDEREIKR